MKIAFLIRRLDRGGAERQLLLLARNLAARGHTVHVIEFYAAGALSGELRDIPNLRHHCLHKTGRYETLAFIRRLIRLLNELQPEIVHGYLDVANIALAVSLPYITPRPKLVFGIRSAALHLEQRSLALRLAGMAERAYSSRADLLIANSYAGLRYVLACGYAPRAAVAIHNGIDTAYFCPDPTGAAAIRKQWRVPDSQPTIGIVGRLDPKKNHTLFLRAAVLYRRIDSAARFIVVGGRGPSGYLDQLKRLAHQWDLDPVLTWTGESDHMPAIYSALSIVTLCTEEAEGFPNVLAEAMACGTGCVSLPCGDADQIIGAHGLIVRETAPDALARAWERSLAQNQPDQAHQRRAHIVERFNIERLIQASENALFNIVRAVESK